MNTCLAVDWTPGSVCGRQESWKRFGRCTHARYSPHRSAQNKSILRNRVSSSDGRRQDLGPGYLSHPGGILGRAVPETESSPIQEDASVARAPTGQGHTIAAISVGLGVAVFLMARLGLGGPSFAAMEAASVPLDDALRNGRPTVVEFYADWCEICRELLPSTLEAEKKFEGKVNFVMLNVDNRKWAPEMEEYNVKGIPEFIFLDSQGNAQAATVGRVPKDVLQANVDALVEKKTLPFARLQGETSDVVEGQQSNVRQQQTMPRDHA